MDPRARSGGGARDESVDVDVDLDVEVDVDVEVDLEPEASARDAFDEAPTALRSGSPGRPTNRTEQLRRLALVGMRVAEVAHKLDDSASAILEYANVLSSAPATEPASRRAVQAVQQAADRCAALSRSVTELATASAARPAPVTAEELLRAARRLA